MDARDATPLQGPRHHGVAHRTTSASPVPEPGQPARRIIFITGDTVSPDTRAFLQRVSNPVLAKPFKIGPLREAIESVLGG
jgi:hypothetical protein